MWIFKKGLSIKKFGSGTLPGLMLDLGLLKIIWEGGFSICSHCGGCNPAGLYPNPFPNPAGER